ncbi:MAG: hypothetical protein P0Y53_20810 [Candidatus Pseudobacter hemicellulosilyticus]|uniref:Lipoprotein n=1 Tax=Candidatus Pseudobacter hemicellulosilyticus TaxID=3121375 RepID=A0AAJ5WSL7_9BACT|nr:MAG: hypothetical protein P0Y53_20810 [Pseudobacter sp.]
MKKLLPAIVLFISVIACNSPMTITANPDDQTATSGTAGSAKMTTQLPPKPDNRKIPDSLRTKPDTMRPPNFLQ